MANYKIMQGENVVKDYRLLETGKGWLFILPLSEISRDR